MSDGTPEFDLQALFQEISIIKSMQKSSLESDTMINKKLDSIQNTLLPIQEEVSRHSKDLQHLDLEKRRKNLIVFGLAQDAGETPDSLANKVQHLIVNILGLSSFILLELDFIKRTKGRPGETRPVLLGLTTQRRKIEILKSRSKLKGQDISIREDCSSEMRKQEKALLGERNKLRAEGKYAVIRSGKLIWHDKSATDKTPSNKRALSESPNAPTPQIKRFNHENIPTNPESDTMDYSTDSNEFDNPASTPTQQITDISKNE